MTENSTTSEPTTGEPMTTDPSEALTASEENLLMLPDEPGPSASDKAVKFVQDHPIASVAGGLALGVLASALLPRRPARKLAARAVDLAEAASAASLMLSKSAMETAEAAGYRVKRSTGRLADRAGQIGHDVADKAGKLGNTAQERASQIGESAIDRASRASDAARSGLGNLLPRRKPKTLAERVADRAQMLSDLLRR